MSRRLVRIVLWLAMLIVAGNRLAVAEDNHSFLHNTNPASALFDCNQQTIGQTGCQAGHRCKCRYDAFGSAMTGMPPGYRWDCGLEHGTCTADIPATTSGNYGTAPPVSAPGVMMPLSSPTKP